MAFYQYWGQVRDREGYAEHRVETLAGSLQHSLEMNALFPDIQRKVPLGNGRMGPGHSSAWVPPAAITEEAPGPRASGIGVASSSLAVHASPPCHLLLTWTSRGLTTQGFLSQVSGSVQSAWLQDRISPLTHKEKQKQKQDSA